MVVPQGIFRDSKGEIVTLNPFACPSRKPLYLRISSALRYECFQIGPFSDAERLSVASFDIFYARADRPAFSHNLQSRCPPFRVESGQTPSRSSPVITESAQAPAISVPQPDGSNAIFRLRQDSSIQVRPSFNENPNERRRENPRFSRRFSV